MIREIEIELDNFRVINALVDLSWSNYAPSEFASGYSECSWKCLSLTEPTLLQMAVAERGLALLDEP